MRQEIRPKFYFLFYYFSSSSCPCFEYDVNDRVMVKSDDGRSLSGSLWNEEKKREIVRVQTA